MRQIVIELLREQFSVVANNTDSLGVKHVTSHAFGICGRDRAFGSGPRGRTSAAAAPAAALFLDRALCRPPGWLCLGSRPGHRDVLRSSIRAEYRYSDFGHTVDYPFAVLISPFSIFSVQHHLTQNQVQFGITHRFD